MVKTPPLKLPVTPAGSPKTVTPEPPPPTLYVILVIGAFMHDVWLFDSGPEVRLIEASGLTIIDPDAEAGPHGPVAVTMKLKDPITVGVPLIVSTPSL